MWYKFVIDRLDFPDVRISLLLLLCFVMGCSKDEGEPPFFPGSVSAEGTTYPTLVIPELGQTWLAQNLDIATEGTSFCYQGKSHYCFVFGRLYTLDGAKEGCARLGPGWQVPTLDDWRELGLYFGGFWDPPNTDSHLWDAEKSYDRLIEGGDSQFNLKKGGGYGTNQEQYYGVGTTYLWTQSLRAGTNYSSIIFGELFNVNIIGEGFLGRSEDRLSCRCIKYE